MTDSTTSSRWRLKGRRLGLFQAPILTTAHKIIGVAAILGFLFSAAHVVTVIVTCAVDGWAFPAWLIDLTGFLAGFGFAFLCKKASNNSSFECKQDLSWILFWSGLTLCVRVLDGLMLFGVVTIEEIYPSPKGPILYANVVSEIVIAGPYALLAFVGSLRLFTCPEDASFEESDGGGAAAPLASGPHK